ncbi:helix-turn-helix domain-containing protein [Corynebacterium kefirresidentii]|nr:helix-turn-helix domain-containing protein [Corynebacterium kefirresidentii]MDK8585772.1 helix-turn-helix domain-containing protein [Corynebacterium kefirresidentii]
MNSKLTTEQAARCLGITPGAVRRRINRGCLPASFEGGRWLIDAKEL